MAFQNDAWYLPNTYTPSGPITVNSGGTISGLSIQGTNSTPAITVNTSSPVTIENCQIWHPGEGIHCTVNGGQLTVQEVFGYGQNPNVIGTFVKQFLNTQNIKSLVATNNTITGAGLECMYVNGAQNGSTISILRNWFVNLQNSPSNGAGGWDTANWADQQGHAVQIAHAQQCASCEVGWNLVSNTPDQSSSDDIFNLYGSSGTSTSNPIKVHYNFVDGSYSGIPHTQHNAGCAFLTDNDGADAGSNCGFIVFDTNYAVNLGVKGFAIEVGHDIIMQNCKVYATGYTPDTQSIYAMNVGGVVDNVMTNQSLFYNNNMNNMFVYYNRPPHTVQNGGNTDQTSNYYTPSAGHGAVISNLTNWNVNSSSAAALRAEWNALVAAAGYRIGA